MSSPFIILPFDSVTYADEKAVLKKEYILEFKITFWFAFLRFRPVLSTCHIIMSSCYFILSNTLHIKELADIIYKYC
jgi:hypothetical protein